jgi:hypothetical protein
VLYALLLAGDQLGRPVGLFDEPLLYVGARSVLSGGWPHLDFVSVYPPLYYVPTAWSFALFGQTALAARLAQVAAHVVLLAALLWVYHGAGLRGPRLALALLAALALSAALPLDPAIFGVAPSLIALSLYLQALPLRDGRWRWALLAAAGLFGGLALLSRFNFGLYALVALSIDQLASPAREARTRAGLERWLTRDVAPLSLAALLVLLSLNLVYAGHVREVWRQSVASLGSPAHAFAFVWGPAEPLPIGVVQVGAHGWWLAVLPLGWLALRAGSARERFGLWGAALGCIGVALLLAWAAPAALPLVALPGLLASATFAARGRALPRRELVALLATSLYAHHYLSQPDGPHQLASAMPALLLLPSLLGADAGLLPRDRSSLLAVAAFFVALGWPSLSDSRPRLAHLGTSLALLRDGARSTSDAERISEGADPLAPSLAALYPAADELHVARFVRARSGPGEPVYVGVADPDGPAVHDLRLSWLLGRPLGSRHYLPISELGNTAAARADIVSDLQTRHVSWVVEWRRAEQHPDSLNSALPRRERSVQQFIDRTYPVVLTEGDFVVRRRP